MVLVRHRAWKQQKGVEISVFQQCLACSGVWDMKLPRNQVSTFSQVCFRQPSEQRFGWRAPTLSPGWAVPATQCQKAGWVTWAGERPAATSECSQKDLQVSARSSSYRQHTAEGREAHSSLPDDTASSFVWAAGISAASSSWKRPLGSS